MNKTLKINIFFYLSVILAVGNVYLFSNILNKKEAIAGLEAQIQDLEGAIETAAEEEQESRENQPEEAQQIWDAILRADYIKMDEREKKNREFIAAQIWEENGIEDSELAGLKAVCPIQREGSEGEIYLFHYFVRDEWEIDDGNYCAIGIDHQSNRSELLFHTEGIHTYASMYEFYDMQVSDVDGNGEEDVILLLGGHRSAGAEYYLPDLYCMLALQKNSKFQCISYESEDWLGDILDPLYHQQTESWKIENVIGDIRSHYGNGEAEAAVETEASLEDVIALKDSRMIEKIDSRSLFFERELLWETYDIDENNHIQGIKVFKERGENGKPLTQIAVYLFDYVTEEVEKLEVPEVYQEITDEYLGSGYIADVQLEEIEMKETEGVKNIWMNIEIVVEQIDGQQIHLPYELSIKMNDKFSSFLWKSWIVDEPISGDDDFGFVITKVNGREIEGVIVIGDEAGTWYWNHSEMCEPFKGTVKENQAECTFQYEGCQAEATFCFQEKDRIEAAVKCDEMDIDMRYSFRPYRLTDIRAPWNDDLLSVPVYFETWGEVNLISATIDSNHSYPALYITDKEGNLLYEDGCINGFDFWDVFVEDLNQDGRQDIWTVIGGSVDEGLKEGSLVDVFYQTGDGRFYHRGRTGDGYLWPDKYFGEYLITRFCPTENYADISETVLTQEEAEQMLGKEIVLQEDFFVSYDSERRMGIRKDRKPPVRESMFTEYRNTYPDYIGELVTTEGSEETYPDAWLTESLREAVGEEYYEKIDGVFYNIYFAWLRFYTLKDEDKLIMHSMLTGQNFILERKESDGKNGK